MKVKRVANAVGGINILSGAFVLSFFIITYYSHYMIQKYRVRSGLLSQACKYVPTLLYKGRDVPATVQGEIGKPTRRNQKTVFDSAGSRGDKATYQEMVSEVMLLQKYRRGEYCTKFYSCNNFRRENEL
jgi:hypothetical protein